MFKQESLALLGVGRLPRMRPAGFDDAHDMAIAIARSSANVLHLSVRASSTFDPEAAARIRPRSLQ